MPLVIFDGKLEHGCPELVDIYNWNRINYIEPKIYSNECPKKDIRHEKIYFIVLFKEKFYSGQRHERADVLNTQDLHQI